MTIIESRASILYDNMATTGPDCYTTTTDAFVSGGYNSFGTISGCSISGTLTGNQAGQDPVLGTLGDNGGNTQTIEISGAPATDAAPLGECIDYQGATIDLDQRGLPRVVACDLGSYEIQ